MSRKLEKILLGLCLIGLSGCARVWAIRYSAEEVTLCGNIYAAHEDFKEKANKYCGGKATFKEGFMRQNGYTFANSEAQESVENCVTFTCGK